MEKHLTRATDVPMLMRKNSSLYTKYLIPNHSEKYTLFQSKMVKIFTLNQMKATQKTLWHCIYLNIYMLFAGWEVRIGKNCARGLEYPRPRAQFFPIRTSLGRQITRLLFSSVEYFVSSFCVEFSLQPFSNLVYACV